jgi:hypothetical protein
LKNSNAGLQLRLLKYSPPYRSFSPIKEMEGIIG